MLDPEGTWIDEFKKLKPATSIVEGIQNLADVIEKLTNKVDPLLPGATIAPGIFQWNKPLFVVQALALVPTPGPTWIPQLAAAWAAACTAGIITPGLVTDPIWTVSSVDTLTVPSAAATIPTIAAGQAAIAGILSACPPLMSTNPAQSPETMAKAFRAGVLAFTFILIGIAGTPISPVPTPIPAGAQ